MTLFEAVRAAFRRLHRSPRTEEAYTHWMRALIRDHGHRHPRDLGPADLPAFLNPLAGERRASASTQNQALCAVVVPVPPRPRPPHAGARGTPACPAARAPPGVLSWCEVLLFLDHLDPSFRLVAHLLDGSGLRLSECLSLRIQDVDLDRRRIMVRRGKGEHDRPALLPARLRVDLEAPIERARDRHRAEIAASRGEFDLPYALREKLPGAASSFAWQYLFPASRPCLDPRTGGRDRTRLGSAARPASSTRVASMEAGCLDLQRSSAVFRGLRTQTELSFKRRSG
jgi:integrase